MSSDEALTSLWRGSRELWEASDESLRSLQSGLVSLRSGLMSLWSGLMSLRRVSGESVGQIRSKSSPGQVPPERFSAFEGGNRILR